MDAPQLSQPEQMMSNQIRQVYEQTQQYLRYATEPHGALMFIDTQIRTLQYMLPIAAQLWRNPALAQQANDVLAYLFQIRPSYQALADRAPRPPSIQPPSFSGPGWPEIVEEFARRNGQIRDRWARDAAASAPPPAQPVMAAPWGCTAVCPQPIGYTYCGKQCILSANHYGPHQCPDGHQWY